MSAAEAPSADSQVAVAAPAANPPAGEPAEGATENAALYVGDLDKDTQETHLFELFSEHGPVHSIRVVRDTVTRRSLGYAYVNFNMSMDPDAAKKAKAKLNYHVLNGKAIRIMWANKNARTRTDKSDGSNSLTASRAVQNLERNITTRELHDTFADFGEILSCKVAVDKDGNSKGYGFIHFTEQSAAKKAIEEVNGAQLGDSEKVVTVTGFVSKQDRGDPKQNYTNLYVKNLPASVTTDNDVKAMFSEFGSVLSVALSKVSPNQPAGKYFAFVNFETHEAAAAAVETLNDKEVEGIKLYVDRAQTKAERQSILQRRHENTRSQMAQLMEGKNVYVKNLAANVDEEAITSAFSKFGDITSVKVMRDPDTTKSRGFGFVCFAEISSAQEAVAKMGNSQLEGKQIYVAFAQPRAVRAQQLQAAINLSVNGQLGGLGKGGMAGVPGLPYGYNGMGYPMVPFAGRGMVPGMGNMYPPIQQMPQGVPGGQTIPNGSGVNGFNPMLNPMMQMMHMGGLGLMPGMGGMIGRGGRSGRGGGRGGGASRGAMRPGRGMGARGPGDQAPPHMGPQRPQGRGGHGPSEESLAGRLANMRDEDRKQQLGEMLFPRLKGMMFGRYKSDDIAEKLASKVTGMMLEMPPATVLYLLETEDECRVKLDEALAVLRDHGALPEGIPPV